MKILTGLDRFVHYFMSILTICKYRISSNKRRVSNKGHPLMSTSPLGIYIEINASLLINAAPLNAVLNQNEYGTSMQTIKQ